MKLLKRIRTFLDVENEFHRQFGVRVSQFFRNPGETVDIEHGLKRTPEGFRVIDKDVAEAGFASTAKSNTIITIYSSVGNVTATFEIF